MNTSAYYSLLVWLPLIMATVVIIWFGFRLLGGQGSGSPGSGSPSRNVLIAGGYVPGALYGTADIEGFGEVGPASSDVYIPGSQSFRGGGAMSTSRTGQTATKLNDGTVLIAGGSDDQTTESYSPVNRNFVAGPQMQLPRQLHTATIFHDGSVLIAGGSRDRRAELYTPGAAAGGGTFTFIPNPMNVPRSGHTATLLADGRVLLAGGFDQVAEVVTNTAELFDPVHQTFTSVVGGMNRPRVFHTATVLATTRANAKVLIVGGLGKVPPPLNPDMAQPHLTGEIYDPEYFPATRHGLFTLVGNDPDPATGQPPPGSQLTEGRVLHSQTSLDNGTAVIAGGTTIDQGDVIGLKTADLYVGPDLDPYGSPTGSFLSIPGGLTYARGGHTATTLDDGTLLIAGGIDATRAIGEPVDIREDAELYDPNGGDPTLPVQPGAFKLIVPSSATTPMAVQPRMHEPRFGATATLLDLV